MNEISQKGGFRSTNTQNIFNNSSLDIVRSPSIFMNLVSIISSGDYLHGNDSSDDYSSYDIDEKIDYNDVVKYRDKIEDYYLYNSMIEKSYVSLNEKIPTAREKALVRINSCYKDCVGDIKFKNKEILKKIINKEERKKFERDLIKNNSDNIIACVIEHVRQTCITSIDAGTVTIEEIEMHAEYIVFHAFVECKVLEKPA
ncbi:TPA: hypothetical protein H1P87_002944 [Salmonella enterica]|uniref:Uncharacterized protein n=3 Tax=Salmonella enterica I TaxID=59201 RepID=A0A659M3J1_SALET|nr:hypothetical protein [Salmonella enterica]TGC33387.1 hypothetical protein C9F01_16635 [Salmonella enterica subsp. enterica serovar Wernigerode]TGC40677.1 hypothetical protein C9E93_05230 [Salmonella enterica subsp. enterica serovar Wernigerode]HAK0819307.1 hypothetical protein [Salmonella enterica]